MRTRYVFVSVLIVLLGMSLYPMSLQVGLTQDETISNVEPIENGIKGINRIPPPSSFQQSSVGSDGLDYSLDLEEFSTEVQNLQGSYDGPTFNKTKAEQKIAYHRLKDGGYSGSMAYTGRTYDYFKYLSNLGGLTTEESENFDKFVTERYNPDHYDPFDAYPNTSTGLYSVDRLKMAIMFDQLGYSLTTEQLSNLNYTAHWLLESGYYHLNEKLYAVEFLNHFNLLSTLNMTKITESLSGYQNSDPQSTYYGGISRYPSDFDNRHNHQIKNAYMLLRIFDILGLTATNFIDVNLLNDYLDQLQDQFDETSSPSLQMNGINYNETYSEFPDYTDYIYEIIRWDYTIAYNIEAYGVRTYLEDYISTGFNATSAREIILNYHLDTYWVDEDNDGVIDREPYFRYFNDYLPEFAPDILDMLGLFSTSTSPASSVLDNQMARNRVKHFMHEEGGFSNMATPIYTHAALASLYHMDRTDKTYLNNIDLQGSLSFLMSINKTTADDAFFMYNYHETYYDNQSRWSGNLHDPVANSKAVIDILDKTGNMNQLDTIRTKVETYFKNRAEQGGSGSFLIEIYNAYDLTQGAAILGISNQIDWSRLVTDVSSYQTRAGGFVNNLYWGSSLESATQMDKLTGINFDQSKYQDLIEANIIEQGYGEHQGLPNEYNESNYNDYVDEYEVSDLVIYLKSVGKLQDWLNAGIINKTKIANSLVDVAWDQYIDDVLYPGTIHNTHRTYKVLQSLVWLGYDINNLPSHLKELNITSQVRLSLDSYTTPDKVTTEAPLGSFLNNPEYTYSKPDSTYAHLKILQLTGNLTQINDTATIEYLNSLQITDDTRDDYGLFKERSYYYGGAVSTTYYGVKALEVFGLRSQVANFSEAVFNRLNHYSSQIGEYYDPGSLYEALRLIGYGEVTTDMFDTDKVNQVIDQSVTNYGFITSSKGYLSVTHEAVESLRNAGDMTKIDRQSMWDFIASLQIFSPDPEYDFPSVGAFRSTVFSGDHNNGFAGMYHALFTMYQDNKIPMIDSGGAVEYLHRSFADIGSGTTYFGLSMNQHILPAVRTFDTMNDYVIPTVVAPISLIQTEHTLTINMTTTNIWRDNVTTTDIEIFLNGVSYGSPTEVSDAYYEFAMNIDSLTPGTYEVNVTVSDTSGNLDDNFVVFDIQILPPPYIKPDLDYQSSIAFGENLTVDIAPEDNYGRSISLTSISLSFVGGTVSLTDLGGYYRGEIPFEQYAPGSYEFTVKIQATNMADFEQKYSVDIQSGGGLEWETTSERSTVSQYSFWNATGLVTNTNGDPITDATLAVEEYTGPGFLTGDIFRFHVDNGVYHLSMDPDLNTDQGSYRLNVSISRTGYDVSFVIFTFERVSETEITMYLVYHKGGSTMELGETLNVTAEIQIGGSHVSGASVTADFSGTSISVTEASSYYTFETSTEIGHTGVNELNITASSGAETSSVIQNITLTGDFKLKVDTIVVDDTDTEVDKTTLDPTKTYTVWANVSHNGLPFTDKGVTVTISINGGSGIAMTWSAADQRFEGTLDLSGTGSSYRVVVKAVAKGDSSITGSSSFASPDKLKMDIVYNKGGSTMVLGETLNVSVIMEKSGAFASGLTVEATFAGIALTVIETSSSYTFEISTEIVSIGDHVLNVTAASSDDSLSEEHTITITGGFDLDVDMSIVDSDGNEADTTNMNNTQTYYMWVTVTHDDIIFSDDGVTLTATADGQSSSDFTWNAAEQRFEGTLDLSGLAGTFTVVVEAVAKGDSSITGSDEMDVHIVGEQTVAGLLNGFELLIMLPVLIAIPTLISKRRKNL